MSNTSTSLIFLIISCWISFSKATKMFHYIGAITDPYKNILGGLEQNFRQQISEIYTFATQIQSELHQAEEASVYPTLELEDNEKNHSQTQHLQYILNQLKNSGQEHKQRRLQYIACQNGGKQVRAKETGYLCRGNFVTKERFEELGGVGAGCYSYTWEDYYCYCPENSFGWLCENFARVNGTVEQLDSLNNCIGDDGYEYMYSYGGMAPCVTTQEGDTLTLRYRVTLYYDDPASAYEGIKVPLPLYFQLSEPAPAFTYEVVGPNVKFYNAPTNIALGVHIFNFGYMTQTKDFITILSVNQLASLENVAVNVQVDASLREFAIGGRYYYDTSLTENKNDISLNGNFGAFEVSGYKEPAPVKESDRTAWVITLIVIGVALVLFLYYFLVYRSRQIELKKEREIVYDEISDELR